MDPHNSEDSSSPEDSNVPYWDSDDALEALRSERAVQGEESNETLTRRLLEEAAPMAAMSIIHIAAHSQNDNTRLAAAKYITDLMYNAQITSSQNWEDMLGEVVSEAELFANKGHG